MPKTIIAFLLIFFIQKTSFSQATIDALALKIPEASSYATTGIINYLNQNFTSDSARVRAAYVWITNNITYDVSRFLAIKANTESIPQPIEDVLKTRATVCQGYASLFVELCTGLGLKAVMIPGLGKIANAITPSHAWAGVELEGKWYLFDPTWGAGYVVNNRFVKAFNNNFYKVPPEQMIKDHMPFDPMYQFVNYIFSNKEFIEGQTAINTTKPFFNYKDSLAQFALLSETEKTKTRIRRLEKNGVVNDAIRQELEHLKKGSEAYSSNDKFDEGVNLYNKSVALYNQYIEHKRNKFSDIQDPGIRQMIDSVSYYANLSRTTLFGITLKNDANRQTLVNFHQNIEKFQKQIISEKEWVTRYLSMDKNNREQFFRGYK